MGVGRQGLQASVVEFTPKAGRSTSVEADDVGDGIMALLQEAAESARQDCARAMELAHKLTMQLRDAEERAGELEAEVNHFRERAEKAEKWLTIIHTGVEQMFFQKNKGANGHG
jgi:predicted  nucleic acid-binding Zn-ribbon protein